jgi:putative transposase
VAALLDVAEHDVRAYMDFPEAHRTKLHSTNPIERLNKEVKRRTDVVGIFPNEESVRRLVGAVLMEQNDDWQLQHRYLTLETIAGVAMADDPALTILPPAKGPDRRYS